MANFDPRITEQMRQFLDNPKESRDYDAAAEILHVITGNSVQYRMLKRKGPSNFAEIIDRKIRELYDFRLANLTHEQVKDMKHKSEAVISAVSGTEEQIRSGKRPDHDSLPDEIQSAYKEALDCLRKIRELHMQIRNLALRNSSCPDSELYPFVKEIIRIDEKRLSLWQTYDNYRSES